MEVVLISLVALVLVFAVVAIFGTSTKRGQSIDGDAEESGEGPTDASYVSGSRPAGPGAEGMAVPEPGEISPGPPPPEDERERSG
jgi:hypothetical protein